MRVSFNEIAGVHWIEPKLFQDTRGFFLETYQRPRYEALGIDAEFVQDNCSRSYLGTLRGLHYQHVLPQAKLCYVTHGRVFDVIVDLREESPTYGCWAGGVICDELHAQLFVPPGLAHGFCVLSEQADFVYKCSQLFDPADQHTLAWNDPFVAIEWPIENPTLSPKDQQGRSFADAPKFASKR